MNKFWTSIYFKSNWGYCVYFPSNIFLIYRIFWNFGNFTQSFPSFIWGIFSYATHLDQSCLTKNIWRITNICLNYRTDPPEEYNTQTPHEVNVHVSKKYMYCSGRWHKIRNKHCIQHTVLINSYHLNDHTEKLRNSNKTTCSFFFKAFDNGREPNPSSSNSR